MVQVSVPHALGATFIDVQLPGGKGGRFSSRAGGKENFIEVVNTCLNHNVFHLVVDLDPIFTLCVAINFH